MFGRKKKQSFDGGQGTAIFINEVGSIKPRVFTIIHRENGKVTIDFGNNETYIISEKNIRVKRCVMYKLPNGRVVVQNPDKWKDINLKKYGIKELRFNLQNFGLQEGKAAIHRWTLPPSKLTQLAPLFKLLMVAIAVGVIGWSALKFGGYALDLVGNSRVLSCDAVLPKSPTPIGALAFLIPAKSFLKKFINSS